MDAEIGIIGGSGFYSLLDNPEQIELETKYGKPSGPVSLGSIGGRKVAFLSRHGPKHTFPPHKVPYRANIEALDYLGVKRIVATSTVGSLDPRYGPGDFLLFDQFINATYGRPDTFYDESKIVHVSVAYPYCEDLRGVAAEAAKTMGIDLKPTGTVAVINGPRFSTKAESQYFGRAAGANVINMTQYPEVVLAREKAICYLGIGLVTDYDAGLEGREDIKPVTMSEVLQIFAKNVDKAKSLIGSVVPKIASSRSCACAKALEGATSG